MPTQKVWLITGASRGIGLAVARSAVAAGDRVALLARGESVHAAAADLGENAMACLLYTSDAADDDYTV